MLHKKFQEAFSKEAEDAEAGTSDGVRKAWITRKGGITGRIDQRASDYSRMAGAGVFSHVLTVKDTLDHGDKPGEYIARISDPKMVNDKTSVLHSIGMNVKRVDGNSIHFSLPDKIKRKKTKEATNVPAKDQGWGKCFYTAWLMPFKNSVGVAGTQESSDVNQAPAASEAPKENLSGFDAVQQLLNENHEINGATLLNLMKSKGFAVTAPEAPKEADAASSNVQALRSKESAVSLKNLCNFRESSYRDNGIGATRYRVVLIKEGMGNFGNAFYYPKDALAKSAALFEGKKCYANHPSKIDEQSRPERDVREIIGHFENVAFEEDSEGRGMLAADCLLMPDQQYEWARGLFRETVEYSKKYPDKDLVGLSINANGDADEVPLDEFLKGFKVPKSAELKLVQAKEQGIDRIRVVSRITDAMSCDLVTEAGAGGKIVKLLN